MWDDLADWWRAEILTDPAYADEVDPLFWELAGDVAGLEALDIGCGTGRVMEQVRARGAGVVGFDNAASLLEDAALLGEVVSGSLPSLVPLDTDRFDLAYAVLVLEHLPSLSGLFREVGRVLRNGGRFVAVANHPLSTAPGSAPVVDQSDGEVLWRIGDYLSTGWHDESAGGRALRFYHRPLGLLLSEAAAAGLTLETLREQGPPTASIERIPLLDQQRHIPRLVGARWRVDKVHSPHG